MQKKNLDAIVLNSLNDKDYFEVDENKITLLKRVGSRMTLT